MDTKFNNSWLIQWGYYSGNATGTITILTYTYNVPIVLGSSCAGGGYCTILHDNTLTKSSFNFSCAAKKFTWLSIGY